MRSSALSWKCEKFWGRSPSLLRSSDSSTKLASKMKRERTEMRRKKALRLNQRSLLMARTRPKPPIQALLPLGWRQSKQLINLHCEVCLGLLDFILQANPRHTLALLLGGDFFTGAVLAAALTKLVLRFSDLSPDKKKANALRAEAMLIMTSTIRVGQSNFSSAPIDEDSSERILNCIQTLSQLEVKPIVHDVFLNDTKAAYSKMVAAQEVSFSCGNSASD